MEKQLLMSWMPFEIQPHEINESMKKNNGKLVVSGVLQRANAKNQNGRVYPKPILDREVKKYYQLIKERRALGELDHPDSSIVNLSNVSHNVLEMHWNGDDLVGTVEILPTPAGNILKNLFESGIKVGISSRGLGSTKDVDGHAEVQEDYNVICWDFVSSPSTHGAFQSPIHESVDPNLTVDKHQKVNALITEILMDVCENCNTIGEIK